MQKKEIQVISETPSQGILSQLLQPDNIQHNPTITFTTLCINLS